jgi:hypothetical protein
LGKLIEERMRVIKLKRELFSGAYIVKYGHLIAVDTPPKGYGKQVISWQSDKPRYYELNYSNIL